MKKAYLFNEFFEMVKEGDNIMTKVDWSDKVREVSFIDGKIHLNDHSFDWDEFFSCNTPLMVVGDENRTLSKINKPVNNQQNLFS